MRRSDTFRGDSRANRDDAVMARGTEKGEGKREKEIRIEREYKGERKHVQRKIEREPGQKHKG